MTCRQKEPHLVDTCTYSTYLQQNQRFIAEDKLLQNMLLVL